MKAETQFENQFFNGDGWEAFAIYSIFVLDLNNQKILFLHVILI
jgi:hypothetical protein